MSHTNSNQWSAAGVFEGLSRNTSQVTERVDGFKRRLEWE